MAGRRRAFGAVFNVFPDRQVGKERIILKNKTDPPFSYGDRGQVLPVEDDPAPVGLDQAGDQTKEGRFPTATGPDQRKKLSLGHSQVGSQPKLRVVFDDINLQKFVLHRLLPPTPATPLTTVTPLDQRKEHHRQQHKEGSEGNRLRKIIMAD